MSTVSDLLSTLPYGPAPEDAKLVSEWLESHNREFGVYVGGNWLTSDQKFPTLNPANGEVTAQISQSDSSIVDQAVRAAREALPAWQAAGAAKRARYLYAIARQIQKNSRLFAVLETLDNGKPIRESRDIDVPLVARHFYYHAGWAKLMDEQFPEYEAVGVCGQIIPWNFPLLMLAWKIAPALATGNTVVLKPAEFTSLTALLFAEICEKAGLPAGVVNIITGDGETGKAIVEHPGIDKIAFTGSTEVGRIIREATSDTHKKLSLELGGKSPFIIYEDSDLDSAVEGLVDAIWFNQGQVCCAGSRLLVQESIAEKCYAKIRDRMSKLRIGDPLDKAVDIGAVIDRSQLERIDQLVETGVSEGAEKFQSPCDLPATGFFYPPTLLTSVEPSSTVAQVEIFGPVLVAMTFRTPEEAVQLGNNTVYGLAASVWTQNVDVAHDTAARIKAGTIWVNCTNQFDASSGFGGYRESGYGREGGKEGLFEYLKWKAPKRVAKQEVQSRIERTESLDRTHKLYIGGKQTRPDGGYSFDAVGEEFALANRKDVRNAVEAAETAFSSWSVTTSFNRAQILYYLAENLEAAREQMLNAIRRYTILDPETEFQMSVDRVLHYAAWADKYEGAVHQAPMRALVYTRNEPLGSVGVFADPDSPLLAYLSACLPLVAMGNTVVSVASYVNPLPAMELVRILEASDMPSGVWNILTSQPGELEQPIGDHLGLAAVWHFGEDEGSKRIQKLSVGNLKQTWILNHPMDWTADPHAEFLRRATQVKNIWVPYGA
ncbi:aldehyde dehydrogenase family protein [Kamptonema cortianum]|nr:aldehyde dehydrogenase family protein [Geitlerinema splendidum]MDK3157602.1 aldehyde dehydrogenase family protein [Kamptonema cortianum]